MLPQTGAMVAPIIILTSCVLGLVLIPALMLTITMVQIRHIYFLMVVHSRHYYPELIIGEQLQITALDLQTQALILLPSAKQLKLVPSPSPTQASGRTGTQTPQQFK